MIKKLHHVGIAVNNLAESVALYQRLLGRKPLYVREAPCQQARAAVFEVGDETQIELLESSGPESAIGKFIKNRGQGPHHICFEVDGMDEELKEMAARGIDLIDQQGRAGLAGQIGFLNPSSTQGVLIQLVQCENSEK
jgi:methylmalonyl-CoA/ethylmalonyl-CoA epimerase